MDLNMKDWRISNAHGDFLVSTSLAQLDRTFINNAFDTDDMSWAVSLPLQDLEVMLNQSVTFGLYEELPVGAPARTADEPSSPREGSPTVEAPPEVKLEQVGMARLITDHITFAYLTDVYVLPAHRGRKLARWLIACVKEVLQAHPRLRRFMLLTGKPHLVEYYQRELGAWKSSEDEPGLIAMTGKLPTA